MTKTTYVHQERDTSGSCISAVCLFSAKCFMLTRTRNQLAVHYLISEMVCMNISVSETVFHDLLSTINILFAPQRRTHKRAHMPYILQYSMWSIATNRLPACLASVKFM